MPGDRHRFNELLLDRTVSGRCLVFSIAWIVATSSARAAEISGEQIFRQKCAACHGESGQGNEDEYPEPLAGDKGVGELAALITKTMPKDEADECVGEDAQKVAAYIHEAFYSAQARARNKPPRIELARLTVRQYRHALADLIGSFRSNDQPQGEHGLSGEYYKSRRFRRRERELERRDATVDFSFGDKGPVPDKVGAEEYAIRWEGSLLAPQTGLYEFNVRTENAARLWINDRQNALIDAWVQSGDDLDHTESVWLLGGRVYPLRLEYFKSKREKTGSVALRWKLPHGAETVVAERYLFADRAAEVYVAATPFPPDDRSIGYERGTSISKAWDDATTDAALQAAGYIVDHLRELAGVAGEGNDRQKRLQEFCETFVERAFGHRLTDEQRRFFVGRQFDEADDPDTAVKRVVLLTLKSPRFLYQGLGAAGGKGESDDCRAAEQLALAMWDSLPDANLRDAARAGQLRTSEQIRLQAERMAGDWRARAKLREFLLQWLRVDHLADLSKDPKRFPEFNPALAADLRESLDRFLDEIIASDEADFRQLLLADYMYLNGSLARFYGARLPEDAPFQKVAFEPEQRAGVLTHPYLLSGFAYTSTSSPIHRGVFISRSVLGRVLRPPPQAVSPLAPDLHPDLTTRERVDLQTSAKSCQACHAMINPLGFTLEHFDAVGRYRKEEKGRAVDATGGYLSRSGKTHEFAGARPLARFLAESDESHEAFVEQLFHYLAKQPIRAYGPQALPGLCASFAEKNFNIRRLMVEIAVVAATRPPES